MTVLLRPMRSDDLQILTGGDSPFTDSGPQTRSSVADSALDQDGALVVELDGACVGDVGWHYVQWGPTSASRSPMIGIWLTASVRGKGVGSTAQRLLVDLLFRHTAVNRVEAHTDVENTAEQRALEGCRFSREGVIRGGQWRDGAFRDGFLYSLLRDEWAARA